MRTSVLAAKEQRPRGYFLLGSTVAAVAVVVLPSLVVKPSQQPGILLLGEVVVAGLLLGAGRQGVDVLLARTLLVALSAPVGWALGDTHAFACSGFLDCYRALVVSLIAFGFVGVVALSLVAVPTNLAWNKGAASLRPELPWGRVRRPHVWWQWVLVAAGVVLVLGAIYLSLGIPAY